jgi:hypothetical protein
MRSDRLHGQSFRRIVLSTVLLPVLGLNGLSVEAVVIHRHGNLGVHVHVLSAGDLEAGAARSSGFGHGIGSQEDYFETEETQLLALMLNTVGLVVSQVNVSFRESHSSLWKTENLQINTEDECALNPSARMDKDSAIFPGDGRGLLHVLLITHTLLI